MYFVSKKLKKRHNITDARAALYGAAETWVDALKGQQFLGQLIRILYLIKLNTNSMIRTLEVSNKWIILFLNRWVKS